MINYLHDGLIELGLNKEDLFGIKILPLDQLELKLNRYIELLQEYNAKFDLINTDIYEEIVIKHILDSLSATKEIAKLISEQSDSSFVIADIGSGAGLPGIPLSTIFFEIPFVLIERMSKRCNFLSHCVKELNLKNVSVEENQAERLEQKRFNICVFRAFRPLEKKMTKVLLRILKENGKLAAYKAKSEKIKEEMESLGSNMPSFSVLPLKVPFLTENTQNNEEQRERNLVIINK